MVSRQRRMSGGEVFQRSVTVNERLFLTDLPVEIKGDLKNFILGETCFCLILTLNLTG